MSDTLDKLKQLKDDLINSKSPKRIVNPNIRTIDSDDFVVKSTNEFQYMDGSKVPVGVEYQIQIDNITKEEIITTGKKYDNKSKRIIPWDVKPSTLSQYQTARSSLPKFSEYYVPFGYEVTKKQRKLKFANRYFVKENFGGFLDFEIDEISWKKESPLYEKTSIKWDLGENLEEMNRKNSEAIEMLDKSGYSSSAKSLNPTQGYLFESQVDKELQTQRKVSDLNTKVQPTTGTAY